MSHSYQDLIVWRKSKDLAVEVYRATAHFPKAEIYGLTAQLRRCAVSVASNIAEGQGRITRGEFEQFLGHSRGSLLELQTQFAIAAELAYLDKDQFDRVYSQSVEVLRLLNGLIDSLQISETKHARARGSAT